MTSKRGEVKSQDWVQIAITVSIVGASAIITYLIDSVVPVLDLGEYQPFIILFLTLIGKYLQKKVEVNVYEDNE
jgi:hypothetical protein